MAITIDGSDRPVAGGSVAFPLRTVPAPRRPFAGLALAVVTAIVTIGAVGPRDAAERAAGDPAGIACPPPARNEARIASVSAAPGPLAWWQVDGPAYVVDPANGRIVQVAPSATHRVVDHRARDR